MAKGTTNGFTPMSQAEAAEAYFQTTDFSVGNDWRTVDPSTAAWRNSGITPSTPKFR